MIRSPNDSKDNIAPRLRALTILQPFAQAIWEGIKPWENRPRPVPSTIRVGDWIALHAGMRLWPQAEIIRELWPACPSGEQLSYGSILGLWQYGGSFQHAELSNPGPWAFGPWCLKVDCVIRFSKPIPCLGHQGWWFLPEDVERLVRQEWGKS